MTDDTDEVFDGQVECWENQRYVVFRGWGPYRIPTDRPLWSNRKGDRRRHLESFVLPLGCVWDSEWHILYPESVSSPAALAVKAPACGYVSDQSSDYGWIYAPDFTVPTKYCSLKSSPITLTRRRRWVRRLRRVDDFSDELGGQSAFWSQTLFYGFASPSPEAAETEEMRQHESFHRFSRLCRRSSIQALQSGWLVSSVPPVADDGDEHLTSSAASPASPKVLRYVYLYGVANCLRGDLWVQWADGARTGSDALESSFESLLALASQTRDGTDFTEIVQDVVRTAPKHPFFEGKGSVGNLRLRNLLLTLVLAPGFPGYYQAFSYIAALLLLNMEPSGAFGVMMHIFRVLLPQGYHEHYLLRHDIVIFLELLRTYYPSVEQQFQAKQIDVSVFASGWLQGLFCAHFPFPAASRFFDVMFAERNSTVLVRVLLAFVKLNEKTLVSLDSSCSLGQFANDWARQQTDVQSILAVMEDDKLAPYILQQRTRLFAAPHPPE